MGATHKDGKGEGAQEEERGAIGRRVRLARKAARLRVHDVACSLERVAATIYRWEAGHLDPPLRDARLIAMLTGCRLAWLLTGEGDMRVRAA